ncbi:unnamed protein product [Sphagnum balticum]
MISNSGPSYTNDVLKKLKQIGHQTCTTMTYKPNTNRFMECTNKHVVVCGGGVIGACTAYFLGKKGVRVTLVEKSAVACAASGKAGGFLALDMCDGSVLRGLARASFGLHQSLAEELDGESYGYRRIHALGLGIEEAKGAPGYLSKGHAKASVPAWVDGPVSGSAKPIGNPKTMAQVHPQLFTQAIFAKAVEKYGVSLVIGKVQEVKLAGNKVTGVVVDGEVIAADTVVVAMGPWSGENSLVSSLTSISGLKAHSIVVRPKQPDAISPYALFLTYRTKEGKVLDPEIYPRPRGEVYVCGMTEEVAVPDDPQQIIPRPEATAMLQRVAGTVSSVLADAEIEVAQACFLPCSEDGVPVIGKIPNVDGAYVATGHSCWGILNAPATGASLAELIVDGVSTTVDLKPFDPLRFCIGASRSR